MKKITWVASLLFIASLGLAVNNTLVYAGARSQRAAVPTNVTAVAISSSQISLKWNDVSNETSYQIQRNVSNTGWSGLTTLIVNSVSYLDSNLNPNTSYQYRIKAVNSAGSLGYSDPVSATTLPVATDSNAPTVPENLAVVSTTYNSVSLSWTASTDDSSVAGYRIYRNGITLNKTATTSSFTDTGLVASTTYTYTVAAYDAMGNISAQSSPVTTQTNSAPVMDVASFSLVDTSTNTIVRILNSIDTIDLASLPSFTVQANTNPSTVGSVVFKVNTDAQYQVENVTPYTIVGSSGGVALPWDIGPGTYNITAVPYSSTNGTGSSGTPLTITLTVVNTATPPPPPVGSSIISPLKPACSDGIDTDGDGLVDLNDPGCKGDPNRNYESDTVGDDGWTVLKPSSDSRMIYVSSSLGNDTNTGLTPDKPVKTLAKAKSLLRSGYPDWMLLKSGDVWTTEGFGTITKSGRGVNEPMVITSYGLGPRPRIDYYATSTILNWYTSSGMNHDVAIVGLHARSFWKTTGGGGHAPFCMSIYRGQNILLEDNYLQGCSQNVAVTIGNNISLRRNIIADSYDPKAHAQGLYTTGVHGLLIEENAFIHNGWQNGNVSNSYDPNAPMQAANMFNHGMYIQTHTYGDSTGVVIRGNILTESSSNTIMLRPGGMVIDNFLAKNTFGIYAAIQPSIIDHNVVIQGYHQYSSGGSGNNAYNIGPSVNAQFTNNIAASSPGASQAVSFQSHVTFSSASTSKEIVDALPQISFGLKNNIVYNNGVAFRIMDLDRLDPSVVANNLFYTGYKTSSAQTVDQWKLSTTTACVCGNITYSYNTYYPGSDSTATKYRIAYKAYTTDQWKNFAHDVTSTEKSVSFVDPQRTVESYNALLGSGANYAGFVAEVVKQSKQNWRPAYTAHAVNEYIRAGFVPTSSVVKKAGLMANALASLRDSLFAFFGWFRIK